MLQWCHQLEDHREQLLETFTTLNLKRTELNSTSDQKQNVFGVVYAVNSSPLSGHVAFSGVGVVSCAYAVASGTSTTGENDQKKKV